VHELAVLEAAHPFGWQRDMMRPIALEVGPSDFALAARHRCPTLRAHRRRTAISFVAGVLNCSAAVLMASASSTALTSPSHVCLAATFYEAWRGRRMGER
jgi:hypothetical protein